MNHDPEEQHEAKQHGTETVEIGQDRTKMPAGSYPIIDYQKIILITTGLLVYVTLHTGQMICILTHEEG